MMAGKLRKSRYHFATLCCSSSLHGLMLHVEMLQIACWLAGKLLTRCLVLQGRKSAASFAQRHFLSEQILETIRDMRSQFGSMLADTKLLAKPSKGFERAGSWTDDPSQIWNFYSKHVAVV